MKRPSRSWLISICAVACLLGAAHQFHTRPVSAQTNSNDYDDGDVYVYAYIDVDSNYYLYAESYAELDLEADEDIDYVDDEIQVDQDGDVFYDDYADPDPELSEYPELESDNPVATGYEYGVASIGYVCVDDGNGEGDDDCDWYPEDYAYASVSISSVPPQISYLSTDSVIQGAQGTLTITGSNLVENSADQLTINLAGSSAPFTPTGTPTPNTATFSYDFTYYPTGTYTLSVTNNEGTSNNETFSVLSLPPPPPLPDPCAVTSNPQAGYTPIALTGAAIGSGTISVSFSGAAFSAISQSVPYGPNSTPSSIAAHIAALVTRNYFQYGLSAKAFGPYVVYSGNTTLGVVSNSVTGNGGAAPAFTTAPSPGAGSAAQTACKQAPTAPPAPNSEVTIVGWINGNAITLPSGESTELAAVFPSAGGVGPLSNLKQFEACLGQLNALSQNKLGAVSNNANDKAYANAWLLKFSANQDPGPSIMQTGYEYFPDAFRIFNDFSLGQAAFVTAVGNTPDPCGSGLSVPGEKNPDNNGKTGTSIFGDQYQLAEVRVGKEGQAGWKTLNNQREIPWVWSVIEFTPAGYPDLGRIQNVPLPLTNPTRPTTNYQIFPTYSVYVNGKLIYTVPQGTPAAFANLPPGEQLSPSDIQ